MKQYDEIGKQERGSVLFSLLLIFFVGGTQTRTFQFGVSAPKLEMQKVKKKEKNTSCCCWCICRNRPPQKLRPPKAEQQRVAKPNPAIISVSRKFTQT